MDKQTDHSVMTKSGKFTLWGTKKTEDKNNITWNNMRAGKQNQQINHGKQQKEHAQCDVHRLVINPPALFMSGVLSYKLHNALCSPLGIQRVLDHVRPRFLYWHRPRWPNADLTTCEVKPPRPFLFFVRLSYAIPWCLCHRCVAFNYGGTGT